MRRVRLCFVVVLAIFCSLMLVNPVSAGTTTSSFIAYTEDFVDATSNLHLATPDLGTHSVFADLQDYGANYDQMLEVDTGSAGFNLEDFVDTISDLHPEDTDIGTHAGGGFIEMQDKDGTFDLLTEADTSTGAGSESINVNAFDSTYTGQATGGSSPYLDAEDTTNHIYEKNGENDLMGWFDFPDTTGSGTLTVNVTVVAQSDDTDDGYIVYYDETGSGGGASAGEVIFTTPNTNQAQTLSLGTFTVAEVNLMRIYLETTAVAIDDLYGDHMYLGVSWEATANYDLDLEVGWTTADFDETNEELCIFGGTQGTEALRVDYWTGSWTNVITDLVAGWNNNSVSITSEAFEIRFTDTTGDAVEADTWEVEGVLLHVWTVGSSNYELDLEIGWSAADFDETVEKLCIYPVTGGGWPAEDIKVDIWTGSWTNLYADLTVDTWNNISIASYLTDATVEVRFLGGTEAGDTTQDTWEIDAVLIEVHSYAYVREDYDAMDLSEIETIAGDFARDYTEAFDLSEVETFAMGFARAYDETFDLSETYSRVLAMVREFEEAIAFSEVVVPAANFALILLEALGIAAFMTTQKSIVKTLGESMTLSDTYETAASLIRTYGEAYNLSDTIANVLSLVRTYNETFDLSDTYVTVATLVRDFGEAFGLSDIVSTDVFISKFLYETITIVEDYVTAATLVRVYNESIGISESLTTAVTLVRLYYDAFALSEVESISRVFERLYYETIGLSDVEVTAAGFAKILYDSITAAAAKTMSAGFVRNLVESITIVATIETIKTGGGTDYQKFLFD